MSLPALLMLPLMLDSWEREEPPRDWPPISCVSGQSDSSSYKLGGLSVTIRELYCRKQHDA
jgi:hypothetical protein